MVLGFECCLLSVLYVRYCEGFRDLGYLCDKLSDTGYLEGGGNKWDMGYYDQTKWDIKEEN